MENKFDKLIDEILQLGASDVLLFDTSVITFNEGFRDACEQNSCGKYGTTWSGPPAIGPISELIKKVKQYKHGIFVQNVFQLEDSFDIEGMEEAAKEHERIFRRILKHIKTNYNFNSLLPLNAGCCTLCPRCTYLDGEPCRYPEEAVSSVECYGIDVYALKRSLGLPLSAGANTVGYIATFLFNEDD